MNAPSATDAHGGILFPLDMFRPTMLAAIVGEAFIAKARNVLDAQIRLTRHPQSQLVLMQLEGSVVGDDPAAFWRENADLALILSQVLPRQVFLYYAAENPRRQGFLVAQQGQALAGDDADEDTIGADTPAEDWPVNRLAAQMRMSLAELAGGFAGGPSIELPVVDAAGDDRELLMTLAGPLEGEDDALEGEAAPESADAPAAAPRPTAQASQARNPGGPDAGGPARRSAKDIAAELAADQKRRMAEREAEAAERAALAEQARSGLAAAFDELGVVVAPEAELGDSDILNPFVVRSLQGDVPDGLPKDAAERLQGKRIDIAVPVEFLSEVLFEGAPLSKADFEAKAETVELDGLEFKRLEVRAPRISAGVLLRRGRAGVFCSRDATMPLPAELILSVAGISG